MTTDLEPPDKKCRGLPPGRLPVVQEKIDELSALDRDQLLARLRQAARQRDLRPEVVLQFARHDEGVGDPELRLAAFEALVRVATPMLFHRMSQLYGMSEEDIQDHQNLVFEDLYRRVVEQDPGLEYGVRRFASFLVRRSKDAMKSRHHPWAPSIEPLSNEIARCYGSEAGPSFDSEGELMDSQAAGNDLSAAFGPEEHAQGQQELAKLKERVARLPETAFKAFLMSRVLGRTQDQIASHFDVTDRTVRGWIASVAKVLDKRKDK